MAKVLKIWFTVMVGGFLAFVAVTNRDLSYFKIPGLGEFRVWTGIPLTVAFVLGASIMALYLAVDITRMRLEIRKLKKNVSKQSLAEAKNSVNVSPTSTHSVD